MGNELQYQFQNTNNLAPPSRKTYIKIIDYTNQFEDTGKIEHGITGRSPLLKLNKFDCSVQVPPDFMHVCSGIVRNRMSMISGLPSTDTVIKEEEKYLRRFPHYTINSTVNLLK